jgi:DNA polymerase-3 subunit delta
LLKIENFLFEKKTISLKELYLLTNLSENFNISELVDNCLAKNQNRIINIINENNFSFEDTIIIIRTFLIKSKRLLKLVNNYKLNQNLENVISIHKPPIFWKEKDLVKKQIKNWTINNTLNLINDLNKIEILIKKNSHSALNILFDFIINTSTPNNSI